MDRKREQDHGTKGNRPTPETYPSGERNCFLLDGHRRNWIGVGTSKVGINLIGIYRCPANHMLNFSHL
jgi:hypothetical protein